MARAEDGLPPRGPVPSPNSKGRKGFWSRRYGAGRPDPAAAVVLGREQRLLSGEDARRPLRTLLSGALAVLMLAALAGGVRGDAPLTTANIVVFLKAGISERLILAELHDRGFAETLDAGREASLREAGASETLMVAVRRAARPGDAGASPAPAGGPAFPAGRVDSRAPTFVANTRTVRVPVSVLDKGGQPMLGLRKEDFEIADDGKRQEVTLFSGERTPLRIALVLDLSGSMDNKIRQVEEALRHFIDLLEPQDQILVLTFSDRVRMVQDFTADRERLARVLDMLEPDGPTALYDATYEAIRRVADAPAESKAVVLVTDGVDTASHTTFTALREMARRSEVPVFSIGLDAGDRTVRRAPFGPGGGGGIPFPFPGGGRGRGPGRGGWPGPGGWPGGGSGGGRGPIVTEPGFDAGPLIELADETGATAQIVKGIQHYDPGGGVPGGDRLKSAAESIAMTLRHRYLLGYEPPEGRPGWRKISVDVDKPSATARTRKGYYAGT
jgi:VWFA-related protein